ncbi:NADP-dependent oxidoreductase domain-containing protein [Armillaria novae-zelandiae]|uniref:NADP-dependent oxidoreductase domain-containing protein n=1 Tax=Armillaria novae-zelandiae TaxID=153914 RepID=A0AA39PN45_9AGAR|nr:NADP-dependent oxidoreductase domain-containing protein [Armillaria novae-zelandiae]
MALWSRKSATALVNPIGFGAMGLSSFYGSVDSDEERFKILDAAYDKGCMHWDSSNVYGDSELLIGKCERYKRNEIFLTSKFGITPNGPRSDPEYVKEQCAISLRRFGVDCIDLYYQHRPDPNVPIEYTVAAMAELVKEGKVKYLGLSECTAKDLRRAHAVHPISAIQVEFSPLVVAYSPLARGLITGQYKSPDDFEEGDFRKTIPKYSKENFPKILNLVDRLKAIASKHNATPGQVTLAWILAQGDDFVVIPGTKKIKYLEENLGAAKVKLNQEEITAIRKLAEESDIPGERYAAAAMAAVLQGTPELSK